MQKAGKANHARTDALRLPFQLRLAWPVAGVDQSNARSSVGLQLIVSVEQVEDSFFCNQAAHKKKEPVGQPEPRPKFYFSFALFLAFSSLAANAIRLSSKPIIVDRIRRHRDRIQFSAHRLKVLAGCLAGHHKSLAAR